MDVLSNNERALKAAQVSVAVYGGFERCVSGSLGRTSVKSPVERCLGAEVRPVF